MNRQFDYTIFTMKNSEPEEEDDEGGRDAGEHHLHVLVYETCANYC